MSQASRHSVSVSAVVIDDTGRILVTQRRDNGRWEIPGGVLELNESIPDGLRREVREETGVLVEPSRLTGVYKNIKLSVVALVFRAHVTSGRPRPTKEAAAVAWWTTEEIKAGMLEAFAIRALDALTENNVPVAIRLHDGVHLLPEHAEVPPL